MKCWLSHVMYWIQYWKWETEGFKYISCLHSWLHGWLEAGVTVTAQHKSVSYHVSLTQDQNSKFEIWFLRKVYCFCTTIKLKNHQWNHHRSRTTCNDTCYNLHESWKHYTSNSRIHLYDLYEKPHLYDSIYMTFPK